jgi:hypothetical protein
VNVGSGSVVSWTNVATRLDSTLTERTFGLTAASLDDVLAEMT